MDIERSTGLSQRELTGLASTRGTPLWVYSLRRIHENIAGLRSAFDRHLPGAMMAYSVKANHRPEILRCIAVTGIGAEVASYGELELAVEAGFSLSDVVFNGPWKNQAQMVKALEGGALVNIDSLDELQCLLSSNPRSGRIGLRVALDFGREMEGDRFGLTLPELREAARDLIAHGLRLAALHAHWGSYVVRRAPGPTSARTEMIWPQRGAASEQVVKQVLRAASVLREECGLEPEILDLGGGLPPVDQLDMTLSSMAEVYQKGISEFSRPPLLLFEPGRAIVWDAGAVLTRVVARRRVSGQEAIVVDVGTNVLPSAATGDLPMIPLVPHSGATRPVRVFGPLCLQTDVLAWQATLPPLIPGDLLLIPQAGAYQDARSAPFIFPLPPAAFLGG